MDLQKITDQFIKNPFPLWNVKLTDALVKDKWSELCGGIENYEYSTSNFLSDIPVGDICRYTIPTTLSPEIVYLEAPSSEKLSRFYGNHGLNPIFDFELQSEIKAIIGKLQHGFSLLDLVKPAHLCIIKLVRAIQILKQEDREIDTSYSHPKIPFSIFISLCDDNSPVSALRLAESILHESMHLKLTLIEGICPLIVAGSLDVYYSPWRDEERPIRGVLHGLFVFRAIRDFYGSLLEYFVADQAVTRYLTDRIEVIGSEINKLKGFTHNLGLTEDGKLLATMLLSN